MKRKHKFPEAAGPDALCLICRGKRSIVARPGRYLECMTGAELAAAAKAG
jgi:hypothetical protein